MKAMFKIALAASAISLFSVSSALADSVWYQIMPVPNAPECKVLADSSGTPIQRRFDKGGARIYAIGGKACPANFPGNGEATISKARSITLDGNFARIITKTRKYVVSRAGSGNRYDFSTFKLDAPK
jgi:hypothetical protein